jgi:nucleoside-diphosphate-sugar epimerase
MNILILGHAGYIGPVLIDQLLKNKKYSLKGIDTHYFKKKNIFKHDKYKKFKSVFKDVRKLSNSDLTNIDAVVYLAAISNDPMGNKFEKITYEINYRSAIKIAKLAKQNGVKKFVFASSCSMYGFTSNLPKTERSTLSPLTAYAKSKVLAEKKLKKLSNSKFNVVCLRFATACGYSKNIRLDLVLNDFVASAVANKKVVVLSDGSPWRPLIHVKDMARAINWAIEQKINNYFLAINTGSNSMNYQIKDIAKKVGELTKGVKVYINSSALPDKRSYKVNFSKFEKMNKKFKPIYTLEKSIMDLKNNYKKDKFKLKNFRNSKYIRLKVLEKLISKRFLNSSLYWNKI